MNIFDITANRIRQVKDGAVNDIEDLYASKSDIQTVLDSKADQADTYTKEQIHANFYDITETYDKTEINLLSNNISSNSFLIGNLTITSNTNFNNISLNTSLINKLNSTMTRNFNNISSNTNLINTNFNNISLHTSLINNLNSHVSTNFNNISSNSHLINTNFNNISSNTNLINNLNSTASNNFNNISSNSHLISQLQTGSFDSNLYYNKITTNNLLTDKLNTSVLNNTLIHNITTTATFKIAEFGNYNNFFEMYNNYFDCYVYGNLSGATMFLNQRGFGDVEINNSSIFQNDKILLNHNTTILSNLQVSGLFSCSSILDRTGSDSRYVLQSDNLAGLITGNTNTINSIITNDSAQDTVISQKLDKVNTTAQTVNSPLILSLTDNTNPIFRIHDAVSNQRLEFKRGCQLDSYQGLEGATPYRLWLGWNTGDVIIGRPNNASRITNNAPSTFNENVTVAGTKKMLCNLIEPSTGTNIDLTASTVTINGTFVDSSDSRLKYDIDNIKSNCMNVIKKFKPKKFKRHDRNDGGKTHIGYIADEVLEAIPKEFENVVSKDREYLGLNYLVLPVLVHKAVLELNDKVDKLEKEIKEFKKEKKINNLNI